MKAITLKLNHYHNSKITRGVMVFLSLVILFGFANQAGASYYYITNNGTGGDCASIGNWNQDTLTCELSGNVDDTIIIGNIANSGIDNSGIVLDGNGYEVLNNSGSPIGVYIFGYPLSRTETIFIDSVTVKNLTISGFETGIHLVYAVNCKIYHNNFIDNTIQAINALGSNMEKELNVFSLDPPIGGNYWSDYDSTNYSECADNDNNGFFDCPYEFAGGVDQFPWTIENGWDMSVIEVELDIKLGSCDNTVSLKRWGAKISAAILGSSDLDVNSIDPSSLRLNGVAPIHSAVVDVVALDEEDDDDICNEIDDDGNPDMILKFKVKDLLATLGDLNEGDQKTLTLTGYLNNGTPITGSDAILIVKKGKEKGIALKKLLKKVKIKKHKELNKVLKKLKFEKHNEWKEAYKHR